MLPTLKFQNPLVLSSQSKTRCTSTKIVNRHAILYKCNGETTFILSALQKTTVACTQVATVTLIIVGLADVDKRGFPPAPVAVVDNVDRVGDERSIVCVKLRLVAATANWVTTSSRSVACVELARLVGGTVVERVADGRHTAVGQAVDATLHLEPARRLSDHSLSTAFRPREV